MTWYMWLLWLANGAPVDSRGQPILKSAVAAAVATQSVVKRPTFYDLQKAARAAAAEATRGSPARLARRFSRETPSVNLINPFAAQPTSA